ncbi:hypothetical protein ACHAXT_000952 [Thalassiosira profunda]
MVHSQLYFLPRHSTDPNMLIRAEVIVGGSDAAGPDPQKGPTLHACLPTAPVHDDNYCPGEILTIGRSDCSVTIDDKCVSKKHLSIRLLSNVQLLEQAGGTLPGFGSPETPEERRACETSPTGIVCVVKDTSKFGTYVSLSKESLGEVRLNADPREQENSGAESDTDDEGAPATLRSYIEPSEFQRAALDLFEKETDATSEEAPRFEMIEQNKPILLLHLSHSNEARPQVTILLGTKGSAIRLSLVPLHFALSQYKPADITAPLHVLGASLSEHWHQRSTHLMAPSKTQSVETLLAVLSGKPIVTKEYASALLRRSSPEDPLPSEEDFRPRGGGVAIECDDISKLRISLKGYRIAVMADDAVAQLVQEAGAAVLRIPEEAPRSQEQFEEWLQGELERATAAKQVLVVVCTNDEPSEGLRAAGARFASPETLASAVMGDRLLDVEGRAIEKFEGWKEVPELAVDDDDDVLGDSFLEIEYNSLIIQGHVAEICDNLLEGGCILDRSKDALRALGDVLDHLSRMGRHCKFEGIQPLRSDNNKEAEYFLANWIPEGGRPCVSTKPSEQRSVESSLFRSPPPCSRDDLLNAMAGGGGNETVGSATERQPLGRGDNDGSHASDRAGEEGDSSSENEEEEQEQEQEEEMASQKTTCLDMQTYMFMISQLATPIGLCPIPEFRERCNIIVKALETMSSELWRVSTLSDDTRLVLTEKAEEAAVEILAEYYPELHHPVDPQVNAPPDQVRTMQRQNDAQNEAAGRNDAALAKGRGEIPAKETATPTRVVANPGHDSPFCTPGLSSGHSTPASIPSPNVWVARKACIDKIAIDVEAMGARFDTYDIAAGEPGVLRLVRYALEKAFDPRRPDLDSVAEMTRHLVTILSGVTGTCGIYAEYLNQGADALRKETPNFDPTHSYAHLMDALAAAKKSGQKSKDGLPDTPELRKVQMALAHYMFPEMDNLKDKKRKKAEKKVRAEVVRFSKPTNSVLNISGIALNLSVVIEFCGLITLNELCSCSAYNGETEARLGILEKLFGHVLPGKDFDGKKTLKDYIVTVLFPALVRNVLATDATNVAVCIKTWMTDTSVDAHRKLVCDKYEKAVTLRADRKGVIEGNKRSCVSDSDLRREIANTLFSLIIGPQIEAKFPQENEGKFPSDFFSKHGSFASTMLRGSWTDLKDSLHLLVDKDFLGGDILEKSDKEYTKMKELRDKKSSDSLAVVVSKEEQMDSLRELVKMLR